MPSHEKDEPKQDTNAWMTTYTDLMTLLLTFFVLLLSISVIEKERQKIALNSLIGAFGFKAGAHSIVGSPKGVNITVGDAPLEKEDVQFERLRNIALKNGLESDVEISKEREKRGYAAHAETAFEPDPLRVAMSLSAKRARALYHFLREKGRLRASRMVTHGFGVDRAQKGAPREKTELSRQVEIVIDQKEKIPFRLRRPDWGDSWLDYKGFFFRTPREDV